MADPYRFPAPQPEPDTSGAIRSARTVIPWDGDPREAMVRVDGRRVPIETLRAQGAAYTTAAPGPSPFTAEGLKAAFNAMEAIETLGLSLGEVTFVDAPEFAPGAVAVLLDGEAFAWMSAEKFAEFRRRVAKEGL